MNSKYVSKKWFAIVVTTLAMVGAAAFSDAATLVLKSAPFCMDGKDAIFGNVANVSTVGSVSVSMNLILSDGTISDFCTSSPIVVDPGKTGFCGGFFKEGPDRDVWRLEITIDDPAARKAADILKKVKTSIELSAADLTDVAGFTAIYIDNISE